LRRSNDLKKTTRRIRTVFVSDHGGCDLNHLLSRLYGSIRAVAFVDQFQVGDNVVNVHVMTELAAIVAN